MEKEFVPYELAVKLKELGFDEHCMATISNIEVIHIKGTRRLPSGAMCTEEVNAPLWQQAFDWFRVNYELTICLHIYTDGCYNYSLFDKNRAFLVKPSSDYYSSPKFNTHEEAKEASLIKLIELITKKD